MDRGVTERVDEQRMVRRAVGLIDYMLRTIITISGRGMNTCSGRKAMIRELIPITENIIVDSGRKVGKRQNRGRTYEKDRTR